MMRSALTFAELKARRRLYSNRAWRAVRLEVLRRDNWQCTECGNWGNVAHHVGGYGDLKSFHDPANIRTVCEACHNEIHRKKLSPRMMAEKRKWDKLVEQTIEHGS